MSSKRKIKITEQEINYRKKHFHEIRVAKTRLLICTSCGNELKVEVDRVFPHPLMGILQCKTCWDYFKEVDNKSEGTQKYCCICGHNQKLYECSDKTCKSSFCKKCLKRNVNQELLNAADDNWKCYICNPKVFWELRAVCSAVMDDAVKANRKSRIDKRTLPSQRLRLQKTQELRKTLAALCDDDDTDSSGNAFVATRMSQKTNDISGNIKRRTTSPVLSKKQLVELESSSSDDCSIISEKLAVSHKISRKAKKRDSSSSEEESAPKSTVRDKVATSKQKRATAPNLRTKKGVKDKVNKRKRTESSESESDEDEDSTSEISNARKVSPKSATHQGGRREIKAKARKHSESTSESEDEDVDRDKTKRSAGKSRASVQKDEESSDSSGKEFQKEKLQKVHRNKFSLKNPTDLEVDHTKTPVAEGATSNINGRSCQNLDDAKQVITECKKVCSNFKIYIETIELQYKNKDDEQLVLKSVEKICKLKNIIERKYTDLTNIYQSWKNPSAKKSRRTLASRDLTESEESSQEANEERVADEDEAPVATNEKEENTNVSECDSDEIFSADETRSLRKKRAEVSASVSRAEDKPNDVDAETDSEDISLTYKDRDDETRANSRNASIALTTLDTSKEENNEQSVECSSERAKDQTNNKDRCSASTESSDNKRTTTPVTETSNSEIEATPLRNHVKRKTLQNDKQAVSANGKHVLNTSMDMFETSYEMAEDTEEMENATEAPEKSNAKADRNEELPSEVDRNKEPPSGTDRKKKPLSETKSSNKEAALRDKVPSERSKESSSCSNNRNEEDLPNGNTQPANKNTDNNNSKSTDAPNGEKSVDENSVGKNESLDDPEALAKKTLLESDSDSLENASSNTEANTVPEDIIKDFIDQIKKEKEVKETNSDDDSDTSTIILPHKRTSATKEADTKNAAPRAEDERDNSPDKKSDKDTVSLDEDAEKEQAAKKALLAASTDESVDSSCDSGEVQKSDLSSSAENMKAKKALLASNSETSSIEASETETRAPRNLKRPRESSSDVESLSTRLNKKRFKLEKNHHYRNDKKLRMSCEVRLARLSKSTLERYSHALQKSRDYLEQKAIKSLTNLAKLEKKRKNKTGIDSDSSTDEDDTFSTTRSSNKQQDKQATSKEESLMDHLKKIENGEVSVTAETDSISDELIQVNGIDDQPVSNEALLSEANRIAKENLLNSSGSEKEVESGNDDKSNDDKDGKTDDKQAKRQKKSEEETLKEDNDKKEKSSWRRDKLLTMKFSDSDSEAEEEKWKKKQEKKTAEDLDTDNNENEESRRKLKKKKNKRRRILDSDSDVILTDCSSDSSDTSERNSNDKDKRKKHKRGSVSVDTDSSLEEKKPKVKRKRIKKMASDSDSSDSVEELKNSQGSTPGKSGRKNIRKVLKDKQVAEDTKLAAKEEEERLKRIAERQALYNNMYEIRLAGEEKVEKLVLDFNTETKEELVTVHQELVKRLKPHQAQGIKFMWDACFESLERTKTTSGSGCIIAHCMGLGKTLQIIALTHALLTHEETGIKTVLVVCPLSTVLNWRQEYETWLKDLNDDVDVYELTRYKKNFERKCQLQHWQRTGGVMIIGYEMFRNLSTATRVRKNMKEAIQECLIDPGADLIVCDEGHLLKNEDTALSKCMRKVRTRRRIVLTGTPLQNNLIEYHCMVQFVKPNLLGTKKEFMNRFVNPITNGQFDNSTEYDVKLMKKRAHVLHKMLEGSVQRFDYSVLTPFLPPKQEYVIFVRLTDPQINMYRFYLDNFARNRQHAGAGGTLFADFQSLQRIWTHPIVLRLNAEKVEKKRMRESENDSEGSLRDFINDDTTDVDSSSDSSSSSDVQALDDPKKIVKRKTRNNPDVEEPQEEIKEETPEAEWWTAFVQPEHFEDLRVSSKLLLLFGILKECEQIGDKVLVFSQSLYSLTLIEEFLRRIDDQTQNGTSLDTLDNHTGSWSLGLDYFRLDGQTSAENRSRWCKLFNKPTNTRARLFLISTRAGGLGINLTAANRVIIFDASWNPSHDVQSIFRIYRFGQKKPCYVYRFLAAGTMEEKIYNRQVTKLSLSCRVVDEQQIERHYSNQNLNELYMFEAYQNNTEKPTLNLPKDRLLAEIFLKYKDVVENYHEHDSLLENKAEEELDEEERKQAWLEYEEEKKGKPPPMMINPNYQANLLMQQYNALMNAGQSGMLPQNMQSNSELEDVFKLIRNDYPNLTAHQQRVMANKVLIDMYNYWEKQAALSAVRNPTGNLQNVQQPMNMPNMAGNSNMRINVQNHAQTGAAHGNLVPNPFTYRNVPSVNNASKPAGNDVIEIRPATSNASTLNAQTAVQLPNANKNQEE